MSAFPVRHIRAPCLLSWTGGRESIAVVGVYSAESHLVGSAGETVFVRQLQEIARLMGWGGYQNLLGEDGSFGGVCTSLAGAKVLEMLYVHKKEVQMFAGLTLRMAKVEPVTGCLPGYTTTCAADLRLGPCPSWPRSAHFVPRPPKLLHRLTSLPSDLVRI